MARLKKACVVVVLALAVVMPGATVASAEEPSREGELARELMEVSGVSEMMRQLMTQMVEPLRSSGQVSEEFWDEFLAQANLEGLEEAVAGIYVKHFTAEEMEATLEFYRSPAGQSILQKMPVVMQESMAVGQQWGMELGQKIAEELEARREAEEE
ncbi:MAG TPA: DUF2059 domain-containing protein [Thermoanaerobaculia bacterium]|nr:DUF2059 domain-containing protein [Thermoanaerobaculia bacterium]